MNKKYFPAKTGFITIMTIIMLAAAPVCSLAFRNPDIDPAETYRNANPSPARRTPLSTEDELQTGNDGSSTNEVAAILFAGEISSLSPQAAPIRAASGFDAFNSLNKNQWQATFGAETGRIKRLYGASSRPYTGAAEDGARAFLKDSHALFGLQQGLSNFRTQQVNTTARTRHVRFQQTYNGATVQGGQVIVHSDHKGQITMVQNSSFETVTPVNQVVLTQETARDIARDALQAALGSSATLSNSQAEKIIASHNRKQRYIWKVTTPVQNPAGLWVYHVDADSGDILYHGNTIFYLEKGKGRSYKTNEDWHADKIGKVKLNDLFAGIDRGFLSGLHADIRDYTGNDAYEPDLKFYYYLPGEKTYFDQVQAYYQMASIWEWWEKNIIKKYGPDNIAFFYDLSIPVYVNDSGYGSCNAYYDPTLPGFVFGNEDTCMAGNEDMVLDNDIVRHEYAHAIMDWAGFDDQFNGELNGYGRSMAEGNSDWYAFLFSNEPEIGDVAFPSYLRTLDNDRMYPWDVDSPNSGEPQEHYTGEIWGGYLYDLSRVLKKKAIPYVYNSSYYFNTAGGHRDGYPDFYDAILAQLTAEQNMTGKNKQSLAAFGSMTSRGLNRPLGPAYSHASNYFRTDEAGSDDHVYLYLLSPVKLKTDGNVLLTGDTHDYPFEAEAGMSMSVKVSAKKGGLTSPSIDLLTIDGTLLISASEPGATKAALTYAIPENGQYVVRVSGTNSGPARGYYSLKLKVK